jgi:hypothetical protein
MHLGARLSPADKALLKSHFLKHKGAGATTAPGDAKK